MTDETIVDIGSPDTWPTSLQTIVAELDRHVVSASHASDLNIAAEKTEALWDSLDKKRLLARHYTRLLPHEIQSILNGGLRLHSRLHFDQRIDDAYAHGYFTEDVAQQLKAITIPTAERDQRGDRDFVCLTVGQAMKQDAEAVAELLGTWGGEGIYFAAGAAPYQSLLKKLGQPAVVCVSLRIARVPTLRFFPQLEQLLLGQFRGLIDVFGDVFLRDAVPPKEVISIELFT